MNKDPTFLTVNEVECLEQLRSPSGVVRFGGQNFLVNLAIEGDILMFDCESDAVVVSFLYDVRESIFRELTGANVEWVKSFARNNVIQDF